MKIDSASLSVQLAITGSPETSDGMNTPPVNSHWSHNTPRETFDLSSSDAVHTFEFHGAPVGVSRVLDNFPAVEMNGAPVKTNAGSYLSLAKISGISVQILPSDPKLPFSGTVTVTRTGIFGTGAQIYTARGMITAGNEDSDDWQSVDSSTALDIQISAGANAKAVVIIAGLEADGHNYYS